MELVGKIKIIEWNNIFSKPKEIKGFNFFAIRFHFHAGVHIYRIERSPVVGKNRSPWVVKRLRGAQSKDEVISSRLLAEANILK